MVLSFNARFRGRPPPDAPEDLGLDPRGAPPALVRVDLVLAVVDLKDLHVLELLVLYHRGGVGPDDVRVRLGGIKS